MKTEKLIQEEFQRMMEQVEIPEVPIEIKGEISGRNHRSIPSLLAAAIIALSFIPFIGSAERPSILAEKTAGFSRNTELGTTLSKHLIDLHNIAENSFNTGGKK